MLTVVKWESWTIVGVVVALTVSASGVYRGVAGHARPATLSDPVLPATPYPYSDVTAPLPRHFVGGGRGGGPQRFGGPPGGGAPQFPPPPPRGGPGGRGGPVLFADRTPPDNQTTD